jgi:hypothetical protein
VLHHCSKRQKKDQQAAKRKDPQAAAKAGAAQKQEAQPAAAKKLQQQKKQQPPADVHKQPAPHARSQPTSPSGKHAHAPTAAKPAAGRSAAQQLQQQKAGAGQAHGEAPAARAGTESREKQVASIAEKLREAYDRLVSAAEPSGGKVATAHAQVCSTVPLHDLAQDLFGTDCPLSTDGFSNDG